jgi:hypothetical protein
LRVPPIYPPIGGIALIALVALAASLATSCGGGGVPESSILIKNAVSSAIISSPNTTGSVTLTTGDALVLKIERTFREDNGNTITSDVTAFAVYSFESGSGVASIDAFGNVSALAPGTTRLLVKFRPTSSDPADICRLDITVI